MNSAKLPSKPAPIPSFAAAKVLLFPFMARKKMKKKSKTIYFVDL